ncbi:decarboxylase [Anabaena sp. UHCC 0253]|uniref:decarboxylase n=1 Tax=Anabaena sp. UHCC 0253 TaxID=2590019 RepID=UPI0014463F76|nr:decarboxylase [Anabaena sp. UHCC 0253]MTJ55117.1 decarboxylase [Anabaena sp. UHCC 0253]
MQLSWQRLFELETEFGDSFFILDLEKFASNYQEFLQSFRSIYPHTNLGYSYKTNYIPKLCQTVHSLGGYAEVVSQMEYDLAIAIGVSPSRIIFNGPLKSPADLENAILAGSIVNLDCLEEVEVVTALARRLPENKIAVGLRCNFDVGAGRISRFGFDVEGGALDDVFKEFRELNNCSVLGLHCHISTSTRSVESYKIRTQKIIELTDYYFPDQQPQFIDIGGGFFGKMQDDLKAQFDCHIPSYQEYAEAIAPQLRSRFPDDSGPELIIEPGVAVVADVLKFVGKVVGIKTVRCRQVALVVGSIHNIKPTLTDKKLSLQVYSSGENSQKPKLSGSVDLVGYTCMEHDCLYPDYADEIGIGDYAVFDNLGAYTVVFKPPFIRPNPPIISYDSTLEKYTLVRRKETSQDVFSTYVI